MSSRREHSEPERQGQARVIVLSVTLAAGAVSLLASGLAGSNALPHRLNIPVWVMIGLFAAAEAFVVHIQVRRQAHSFSMSEIPLVLGLLALSPAQLVGARLLGSLAVLVFLRRQGWMKLLFNLSYFALDAALAAVVFRVVLGGGDPLQAAAWLAAMAATTTGLILGAITVTLAIAASEGRPPRDLVSGVAGLGLLTTAINTNLAIVSVLVLSVSSAGVWLLVGMAAAVVFAYRAYTNLGERHHDLQRLYEFTRTVGADLDLSIMRSLLHQARSVLRAESAEVTMRGDDGVWTRVRLGADDVLRDEFDSDAAATDAIRTELLAGAKSLVLSRGSRDERARRRLGDGVRNAVIVPLRGREETIGTLMVTNRLGDTAPFDTSDGRLLETVANHASVSLRNSHLVGQLRREVDVREHQALHDALTSLPNRILFDENVRAALAARNEGMVAVMLIDLDRFKEVNDTLGHHQGDLLLVEVADRLQGAVGEGGLVARLGGDEFAVVLPVCPSRAFVRDFAVALADELSGGFLLGELTVDVRASVGIAIAPDDGVDAALLLQRADVAMYAAKSSTRSAEFYDPARDHYSPERLALMAVLRRTLENDELLVQFQPIADVATDEIVGVEALARWHHPELGFIPPEEFVAMAEASDLIRLLTQRVLAIALRQCRQLRDEKYELGVSVNLSVRSLLDDTLPEEISRLLALNNLPPSALTLEITESVIMAEPARTIAMLNRLSSMGVALAIDDFGTGYSSLSYLKRMPVDELKIDKSFVLNMVHDENDATIVRSIIDLAGNLGLDVVAEGIEDAETWEALRLLGCSKAQGYHLSRPVTGAHLIRFLRARSDQRATPAASDEAPPAPVAAPLRIVHSG